MSFKKTVIATGLGIAAGFIIKQQLDQYQNASPENVLNKAKEAFKQQGPISGSWIYMKPEEVEKHGLTYTVYKGGVTRNIDGENIQYEFYADTNTGSIISSIKTS